MNKFEFVSYDPTPGEKYIGIVAVIYLGKILLRFKIMPNKEGNGFYPLMASYKVGDEYVSTCTLDSNIEKAELDAIIKKQVKLHMEKAQVQPKVESCGVVEELPF